jgi:hypothetical protein
VRAATCVCVSSRKEKTSDGWERVHYKGGLTLFPVNENPLSPLLSFITVPVLAITEEQCA